MGSYHVYQWSSVYRKWKFSRDLYFKNFTGTGSIREIKILEFENEGPFVKYTGLENNHLYGSYCIIIGV